MRAAVGLPRAQPAEQRAVEARAGTLRPRRGFSTATVPSSRSVRKTSSCEPASGPGTSRRSARPPSASRACGHGSRCAGASGPCPPRPRAASRSCAPAPAAGSRPRGTAARRRVVAPDEVVRLVGAFSTRSSQRQRGAPRSQPHATLERERRAPAAHAADQLDGVAALARDAHVPRRHAPPRRGTAARRRGTCRRRCSSEAAPASRRRSCAGTDAVRCPRAAGARRLQAPGRLEEDVDAGRAVAELVDLAAPLGQHRDLDAAVAQRQRAPAGGSPSTQLAASLTARAASRG